MYRHAILDEKIEHQGIGGKEIIIEKELTISDVLNTNLKEMTIAMSNFIMRRKDFMELDEDMKVYYGHVGFFGYFVADDEIVEWLD